MNILLLVHSFNSLSQRLFVELTEQGHTLSVEFDINDQVTAEAVTLFRPSLIIAPFLKRPIPEAIWKKVPCLIIHPGPPGDRGPSALDWAILNGEREWGVTVLQANEILDGGDIWAHERFPMRMAAKSSIYRQEVVEASVSAVMNAVERISSGTHRPQPQHSLSAVPHRGAHPLATQQDRAIDWKRDDQQAVLRKIRSADGLPGVLDRIGGRNLSLHDAYPESSLSGEAGAIIARSGPAICRATADGKAVWIGRLRDSESTHPFKLPATAVLSAELEGLPETTATLDGKSGFSEIRYRQQGEIGLLRFSFHNGAMGSEQCQQLLSAYRHAKQQDTRAIILLGGEEYWSNGMDLNQIEAAERAADESWMNINAMDDLALEIIETDNQLTFSTLQGNAAAGGLFLARCADYLWAREGVVLNPHYRDMGNLYGSEYWSYLLPRYAGEANGEKIMKSRLPMGGTEATRLGLVDAVFGCSREQFIEHSIEKVGEMIRPPLFSKLLHDKQQRRTEDESRQPLADYRQRELEQMRMNFYGSDPSYHIARYNFVHKVPKSRTPLTLAIHRRVSGG